MSWDQGIAARLRAAGVRVVEVSGWQTRGSTSFAPRGSVNHHTAGSSSGATPSLNTCIYGRPDLAGPLCNVMQSREADGNDIAYVIAAGRANHAGSGGWKGLSGNSSVYGLEIEHTGTSPLPQGRQQIAAAIHAAMFAGDVGYVCQHYEWAPGRKIDAAQGVDGNGFRQLVQAARSGGGPTPTPDPTRGDDEMVYELRKNDGFTMMVAVSGGAQVRLDGATLAADAKKSGIYIGQVNETTYNRFVKKYGKPEGA